MKKGFTVVELIVSFSLTMVIVVFLFQIVISLKNMYTANSLKTELLNKQAIISDKINSSFNKKTITNVTKCGSYCLNFIYSDNSSEMLKINYNENSFQFGSYKTLLPDNSYMSNPSIDIVYSGTFLEDSNNSILVINIPIYSDFLKNQNYGINVMYQYNSNDYDLYLPGFNDYDGKYGYLQLNGARNLVIDSLEKYNESGYKVFDSNGEEISDANVRVNNPFANMEIPYQTGVYKIEYSLIYEDVAIETLYRYVTVTDAVADFDYTGSEQVFTAEYSGYYKLEAWGAEGGTAYSTYQTVGYSYGGLGAYTSGVIYLEKGDKLYIYVGGRGIDNKSTSKNIGVVAGGYNGGGAGYGRDNGNSYVHNGASGGGATDIRYFGSSIPSSSDLTWNSTLGLNSRIMVAAGGGGGSGHNGNANGGYGGTLTSENVKSNYGSATGVNQTSGNSFGIGGTTPTSGGGGGGAGGYYGGRTAAWVQGTGGSSYISGYAGCIAIKSATDRTPKVTTYTNIEDSYHYSGKIFIQAKMLAGNEEMPQPNDETSVGHSGNGYAKITFINSIDFTYDYTGSEQTFVADNTGYYKLEVWGAQGGTVQGVEGGYGGYSTGLVYLEEGDTLYINVGGQGKECPYGAESCVNNGGYNGGGYATPNHQFTSSGGGATHIALQSGLLYTLASSEDKVLIVAGGGGGSGYNNGKKGYGGSGGGYIANSGTGDDGSIGSSGGSQLSGGHPGTNTSEVLRGSGVFGLGASYDRDYFFNGGGGGYYGGGATGVAERGAGGGSGYIGNTLLTKKSMYCYNCSTSNEVNTLTYSVSDVSDTAISKYAKKGNGYARISYVGTEV